MYLKVDALLLAGMFEDFTNNSKIYNNGKRYYKGNNKKGREQICSFMFSLVTSSKLIIFALFYNIVTFNSLIFMYYVFACFICISPNEIL